MAVWLIAILVCLLALLAAVLRFRHNRRSRRKEEETFTSPKEDTPRNEIEKVSSEFVTHHYVVDATAYCSNGCQGACACPVLENWPEVSQAPVGAEDVAGSSIDIEIATEPNQGYPRKSSQQRKFTFQYLKEKLGKKESVEEVERHGKTSERKGKRFSVFKKKSSEGSHRDDSNYEGSSGDDVTANSSPSERRRDSLKLLRGMLSFKERTSNSALKHE